MLGKEVWDAAGMRSWLHAWPLSVHYNLPDQSLHGPRFVHRHVVMLEHASVPGKL